MHPKLEQLQHTTRRQFLQQSGSLSLGAHALCSALAGEAHARRKRQPAGSAANRILRPKPSA